MFDSPIDVISSTVQIEQNLENGAHVVGTGFLVSTKHPDGSPRTILITADHVFRDMKKAHVKVGFRLTRSDGGWTYTPADLRIRDDAGEPLWTAHGERDVAAITITAPPEFARAAIPVGYLAADEDFAERHMATGDELLVLGYPRGLASNEAGFPILRAGRIASYPVSPKVSPTFLLDFSVFPGNSGGPVFLTKGLNRISSGPPEPFIAGILTQQVQLNDERLEIGIVTHAKYVAETIDRLYGRPRGETGSQHVAEPVQVAAQPAAHQTAPPSFLDRLRTRIYTAFAPARLAAARLTRAFAGRLLAWAERQAPSGEEGAAIGAA